MAHKRSRKPIIKIVLITLAYFLLAALGYFMVWIALNMAQTMFIRILIGASGVVWAVMSISFVWFRTDYSKLWTDLRHKQRKSSRSRKINGYPEFLELKNEFPLAVRRHEQHCQHHRIDVEEMVKMALEIPREEWESREEFRRIAHEERHGKTL